MSEESVTPTITLNNFRSWLQGVEDMQEEGWTPSPTQWAKIRSKIDMIEQPTPSVNITNTNLPTMIRGQMIEPAAPPYIPPYVPPVMANPQNGARVTTFMNPAASSLFNDNPKTPDIDTSSGQYTAPFV